MKFKKHFLQVSVGEHVCFHASQVKVQVFPELSLAATSLYSAIQTFPITNSERGSCRSGVFHTP